VRDWIYVISDAFAVEINEKQNKDVLPEMEKRADGADASVLFFLLGCANFLAVYVQIR